MDRNEALAVLKEPVDEAANRIELDMLDQISGDRQAILFLTGEVAKLRATTLHIEAQMATRFGIF